MKDKETIKYKIGIDEVGRGPIAGPVCVCSFLIKDENFINFVISRDFEKDDKNLIPANGCPGGWYEKKLPKLRDSKKLSKKQREEWFNFLKTAKEKGFCDFSVFFVSSENIDKFGITKCIQKSLDLSLLKLIKNNSLKPNNFNLFLDGGLRAPKEFIYQKSFIKGDEIHPVISLSSIIAKVSRDRVMKNYSKKYPRYFFEKNSGYGTKAHYDAIKKYGLTDIHRRSFIH